MSASQLLSVIRRDAFDTEPLHFVARRRITQAIRIPAVLVLAPYLRWFQDVYGKGLRNFLFCLRLTEDDWRSCARELLVTMRA